jgi:hypothetical protein
MLGKVLLTIGCKTVEGDMDALFFLKGLIGQTVFCAAVFALLTQLQIQTKTPAIFGVKDAVLLEWHRWAGRIALGGFVLSRMMGFLVGAYPTFPLEARHLAHGALSALCAVAVLSKIWATRHQVRWGRKRALTWGASILVLGAGFSILTCGLAVWRWANPNLTWVRSQHLIYQAALVGHVGLALALIGLGRLVLVNRRGPHEVDTFVERDVMGGRGTAKHRGIL